MAIKFLSGLNLSNVTAGSILKLDSNGNIVAATAGTDYATSNTWSTASNSNIYYNSGGVRIGTYQASVDAAAQLHVFDYQTTDPKLLIEDGNTGDASMQFKISAQQWTVGLDNSDSDKFKISAGSTFTTTDFQLDTSGRLGIGTAPSSGYSITTGGKINSSLAMVVSGVETGNPQPAANNAHLSGYGIIGNRGTFYVTNNGTVQIGNGTTHNANPAASFTSTSISLKRSTDITSSDYIDLKINQTDSAAIKMGVSSASTEGFIMTETTGGSHLSTDPVLKFLYNDGTVTEYARFKTEGLDITGRLDVASDIRLRGSSSNNDLGIVRLYTDAGNHLYFDTGNNGGQVAKFAADGSLTLSSSNSQGLTVKQSASLGADMQVEIRGSRNAPGAGVNPAKLVLSSFDSDDGNGVVKTGAEFYMESTSLTGGDLTDFEAGIRYRKDGSVVDGLSIHDGEVKAHGYLTVTGNEINMPSGAQLDWANGDARIREGLVSNYSLSFQTYTGSALTTKMFISSGGNTGVGTTSPAAKLDVAGSLKVQSGDTFGYDSTHAAIYMDNSSGRGLSGKFGSNGYARNLIKSDGSATIQVGDVTSLLSLIKLDAGSSAVNGVIAFRTKASERMRVHHDGNVGIGTTSPSAKLHVSGGNILVDAQYGIRFVDANTRIYTNSDSPEDLIIEADQNLHLNPDGSILAQSNISMEGGSIITTDSNNALVLRSDVQHGQGDEDAVISFKQSTTEHAKIDQSGYMYAAGFKTTTASTGLLRADGTVDTTTLGTMASANTSDYKDSDTVESYVATELTSYTPTSSFGSNAFTSYTDHSTQGYLTALPSHNHDDRYYTETELNGFFKSITHQGNYISTAAWSLDGSGSVANGWSSEGYPFSPTADFSRNGSDSENTRILQELPNGAYGVVWRTPSNDASSDADGGWDMDIYNVHHSKAYRSIVMFQVTDDSTSGTFYHGCHGSHTLNLDGTANSNPYFQTQSFANLVQGRWYISVGYIQPYQYPSGTNSTRSGIYDCYTGKKVVAGQDYMMKSGSTRQRHRTYQYYSTDTNSSINWWNPRFEELNGNEPSIAELIQKVSVDGELGLNFHSKFPADALDSLTETTDATDDKILLYDESANVWKHMTLGNLQDSIDNNTTYSVATTSADGLMSSTDKTKLDGVATGADVTPSWVPDSDPSYLTSYSETDTLDSVADRGATTNQSITVGGLTTGGTVTADVVSLTNDATDTFRHRMSVYDSSGGVSYGMMLWNSNGTSGDWGTMIYGPNQSNRRISFGKVNTTTPTNHSHVSEIAHFDLDDSSLNLTGDLKVNGGDVTITKQNDAPTLTLLHDGTNPSTNDLLFKMQFQSDYDGTHQNWGKIICDTNSSSVRTNLDFFVKSASGAEQLGFRIEGQPSATPKAYFYNDVDIDGTLSATAKSFDIEHPTKEGKRLVYGSLEGAEHGVYFRGKGTGEVIELPEHWTGLVHEDSITVQLTPIGKNCVWVEDIKDNSVHVGMDNDTPYFYFIQGERKDIDKLIVEQDA